MKVGVKNSMLVKGMQAGMAQKRADDKGIKVAGHALRHFIMPFAVLASVLALGACADVTATGDNGQAAFADASSATTTQTTAPQSLPVVQLAANASVASDENVNKSVYPQLAADGEASIFSGDPLEPFNKIMFGLNDFGMLFLSPVTRNYEALMPVWVKDRVSNSLDNLNAPVTLANDLLQQEWDRAWVTLQRFVINSTVGVLGMFDVAYNSFGLEPHKEDFGQTMGSYGVGDGPYLVLPLIGPSNPRDLLGRFVDGYIDPVTYLADKDFRFGRSVVTGVVNASEAQPRLDEVRKSSIDYYAAVRALYRQKRQSDVENGSGGSLQNLPAMAFDDEEPFNTDSPAIADQPQAVPQPADDQQSSVSTATELTN